MSSKRTGSQRAVKVTQKQREINALRAVLNRKGPLKAKYASTPPRPEDDQDEPTPTPMTKRNTINPDEVPYLVWALTTLDGRRVAGNNWNVKLGEFSVREYDAASSIATARAAERLGVEFELESCIATTSGKNMVKMDKDINDSGDWKDLEKTLRGLMLNSAKALRVDYKICYVSKGNVPAIRPLDPPIVPGVTPNTNLPPLRKVCLSVNLQL